MAFVTIYADLDNVFSEIEDEDLIAEIIDRLDKKTSFKREFCRQEDIKQAIQGNLDEDEE